ncbi:EGF-like domain protein [Oesophagostomum dentatum]|uniref:EGF-like domain protein n=1 Tax=Oesophagostomum dentatum TaxID=61180 RepID=A0A0B1S638_OESDE|nr:EGF-like domain protein [Oesophagostomum dentatum]
MCSSVVNECATTNNECSQFAKCVDLTEGYTCQCLEGYVDVSSKHKLPPGRRCSQCKTIRTFSEVCGYV